MAVKSKNSHAIGHANENSVFDAVAVCRDSDAHHSEAAKGSPDLLASVTYDYDLAHWNRNASVVRVAEAPSSWPHALNTVAGNRVLVDQQGLDTRLLAVNEIVGGASANTIIAAASGNWPGLAA